MTNDFLATFLEEALDMLEQWEQLLLQMEKEHGSTDFNALYRIAHNLKGNARSVGLDTFGSLVHKVEDILTALKSGRCQLDAQTLGVLLQAHSIFVEWVAALREGNTSYQPSLAGIEADIQLCRDAAGLEATSASAAPNTPTTGFVAWTDEPPGKKQKAEDFVRVPASRITELMNAMGELSIHLSIAHHLRWEIANVSPMAADALGNAFKIAKELRAEVFALRLQPADRLFQRGERAARDIAQSLKKSVDVVIRGEDIELDKAVMEKMRDPLVHIIRNAVDHGIELPEERQKIGKPGTATLTIEGERVGGNIMIRVSDDGRGLNEEKIAAKARSRGLIKEDAEVSPAEIHKLIFHPGFSTSENVTEFSGRGVGMDVVKSSVDELQGSVLIKSLPNKGTTFEITLPTNISVLEALIVRVDHESYAIPVRDVFEVIDLNDELVQHQTEKSAILSVRGQLVRMETLGKLLPSNPPGVSVAAGGPTQSSKSTRVALLVRSYQSTVAFQIDQILSRQSIVMKPLNAGLAKIPGLCGTTVLPTGEAGIVVNLPRLIEQLNLAI